MQLRKMRAIPAAVCMVSSMAVGTYVQQGVASAATHVTINFVNSYGPLPASMWLPFEQKTGIRVNYTNLDWGSLQDKIAAAAVSHTYFADVTDVDWSKTGEYSNTGWFVPLNKYFNTAYVKAHFPAMPAFISPKGTYYGIPGDSQFLVTTVNVKDFKAAGITSMPKTMSQYTKDLEVIKQKGIVKYPLAIPLAAAEYLSTYFYETTNAFGGTPLSCKGAPTFNGPSSAGYKAVQWIVNSYKSGLVAPGDINHIYSDVMSELAHNQAASIFSDYSGNVLSYYNIKADSTQVGNIKYIPTPGVNGPAYNFTDPDGLGIPVTAKHLSAAVSFIKWFTSPSGQVRLATAIGIPANDLADAAYERLYPGVGQATLDRMAKTSARPVFPCGAPAWYPEFSSAVNTNIHSAAAGQESVAAAVHAIYATAEKLYKKG